MHHPKARVELRHRWRKEKRGDCGTCLGKRGGRSDVEVPTGMHCMRNTYYSSTFYLLYLQFCYLMLNYSICYCALHSGQSVYRRSPERCIAVMPLSQCVCP